MNSIVTQYCIMVFKSMDMTVIYNLIRCSNLYLHDTMDFLHQLISVDLLK